MQTTLYFRVPPVVMHCTIDLMPGIDQNEVEAILRTCTVSDSNALCAALQMKCQSLNLFISHSLFIFFYSLIMAPKLRETIAVFICFNFFNHL